MTQVSVPSIPSVRIQIQGVIPKFPDYDMPKRGWPYVWVVEHQAHRLRAPAVALVQEALTRWGMASICSTDLSFNQLAGADASHALINKDRRGVVELRQKGVHLIALVDGLHKQAVMDIEPSTAPDEVAMWFVEHLWAGPES